MSKIIRPFAVNDAALISTTVTESVAAYDAATVYKLDDTARSDTEHRIYRSTAGAAATVTMTIASPAVISKAAHGYANATPVAFSTTGALPTGITAGTIYYIVNQAADTFQISATVGGSAINTSGSQSGVHTAVFNPNKGNDPTTDTGTHWIDIGPTNAWAMFDSLVGTQSEGGSPIEVEVATTGRIDSVALLNVTASEITIVAEADAVEVYNQTFDMIDYTPITDWWAYFFEELDYKSDLVATDIPPHQNMTFNVTVSGAKVGLLLFGLSKEIGGAVYGSRVGINDYSRKEVDDFGNYTIVQRAFSKRGQFAMFIESQAVDALYNLFAQYRTTPVLWVMTEGYTRGQIFGFYRSFEFVFAHPQHDEFDLVIEGLT